MDAAYVDELKEITDPTKVIGFSVFARSEQLFATSDVDLAAFLRLYGASFDGTATRIFNSRGRDKKKVFIVFQSNQALDNAITKWDDNNVGGLFRSYCYLRRSLMGIINDSKDLENE